MFQNNCYIDRTRVEVLEMVLANYQTRLIYLKERKKQIYEQNQNGTSIKEEANWNVWKRYQAINNIYIDVVYLYC